MGAIAKQSGSSGAGGILLSALDDSVDIDRCPATLRNVDATACGGCCRRCLQGTFKEDFTDGHSSEVIEAMFATGCWNAMMVVWC